MLSSMAYEIHDHFRNEVVKTASAERPLPLSRSLVVVGMGGWLWFLTGLSHGAEPKKESCKGLGSETARGFKVQAPRIWGNDSQPRPLTQRASNIREIGSTELRKAKALLGRADLYQSLKDTKGFFQNRQSQSPEPLSEGQRDKMLERGWCIQRRVGG